MKHYNKVLTPEFCMYAINFRLLCMPKAIACNSVYFTTSLECNSLTGPTICYVCMFVWSVSLDTMKM